MKPLSAIPPEQNVSRVRRGTAAERWMDHCLELARRGAGHVSPNPLVGAVLVGHDGTLLGEGWHQTYGGAHAERNAIDNALAQHGVAALSQATLYVNLEPCSHYGKTPPCADYILKHKIPHLVVGMVDPNPEVAGNGLKRLRNHGVSVVEGVLEKECRRLNEAFSHHIATKRPLVTLKIAQSLDGRVATATGDSRWVSGPASRALVHRWRSEQDAVMVGAGTAVYDDPQLTVRHVEGRQPYRVFLDRQGNLPDSLKAFTDDFAAWTWVVVSEKARPAYESGLVARGGRVMRVSENEGHLDLVKVFRYLGEGTSSALPVQTVLVEAGPGLATALLRQDLVDRLYVFVAPKLVGEGIASLANLGVNFMKDALHFTEGEWYQVEQDLLFKGYFRSV